MQELIEVEILGIRTRIDPTREDLDKAWREECTWWAFPVPELAAKAQEMKWKKTIETKTITLFLGRWVTPLWCVQFLVLLLHYSAKPIG